MQSHLQLDKKISTGFLSKDCSQLLQQDLLALKMNPNGEFLCVNLVGFHLRREPYEVVGYWIFCCPESLHTVETNLFIVLKWVKNYFPIRI